MMASKDRPFKVGDSVRFKDGEIDEGSGVDMSGWQGRITEVDAEERLLLVAFDSITLRSLPREYLEECEEEGLSWSAYYIRFDDVEAADARDRKRDVRQTIAELSDSLGWAWLGEEGREINAILAGADEAEEMEAWEAHLREVLTSPFKARISEWQNPGSVLQAGQRVRVTGVVGLDEQFGVLVNVKMAGRTHIFPLCDLTVLPSTSPNHEPVQLYAVWFANR